MRCALLSIVLVAVSCLEFGELRVVPLVAAEAPKDTLALLANDTIFFREEGGELRQVLHVSVLGDWEKRGTFRVEAGGEELRARCGEGCRSMGTTT